MRKKSKGAITLAILLMSMYLNVENVISLMLVEIQRDFPALSLMTIQKIPSNVNLIETVAMLWVGWLTSKINKRKIIIIFQGGTVLGAMMGYFFGSSFGMLYFSFLVLGVSCGIIGTIARSATVELFSQEEMPKIMALSQIANTLGTSFLQILGGYLITISWRAGFLSFLIGLLSMFSAVFLLPDGPLEVRGQKGKNANRPKIWTKHLVHDIVLTVLVLSISSAYTTNITFLVDERGLGDTVIAGYLSSVRTIAMFFAALALPWIVKVTKKQIITVSGGWMLAGYLIVAYSRNIWGIAVGSLIAGFGMGTFTPAIFLHVAKHVQQNTNAMSHAWVSLAGTLGLYLYPYLILAPSMLLGETSTNRLQVAMIWLVLLMIGEILFEAKEKEY